MFNTLNCESLDKSQRFPAIATDLNTLASQLVGKFGQNSLELY